MSEEKAVLGGMSEPREPTEEDQAILDKVKEQYEKQSGKNPGEFKAILVGTQFVAGTNYFIKVYTGEDTYIHVRVFVPLPGSDEGPTLVSFQANKTKDDELQYFEANDKGKSVVDTGEDTYIHIRVFVTLPGSDEGPTLVSFWANKTKDDELECFKAKDEDQLEVTCSKTPHPFLLETPLKDQQQGVRKT